MLPETLIRPSHEATSSESQIWKALADGGGGGGRPQRESNLFKFTQQVNRDSKLGSPLPQSPFLSRRLLKENSQSGGWGLGWGSSWIPQMGQEKAGVGHGRTHELGWGAEMSQ